MSSTAIDPVLQITAPARNAAEPAAYQRSSDRPAFEEHLQRAASEVQPPRNSASDKTGLKPEHDEHASTAEEKDSAASNQEESNVAAEQNENAVVQTEDEPEADEAPQDEVVISDAVAPLLEAGSVDSDEEATTQEASNEGASTETKGALDSNNENAQSATASRDQATKGNLTEERIDAPKADAALPAEATQPTVATRQHDGDEQQQTHLPATAIDAEIESLSSPSVDSQLANAKHQSKNGNTDSHAEQKLNEHSPSDGELTELPAQLDANVEVAESTTQIQSSLKNSSPASKPDKAESPTPQQGPTAVTAETRVEAIGNAVPTESTPSPATSTGGPVNAPQQPAVGSTATQTSPSAENQSDPDAVSTIDRARFVQRVGGAIRSAQSRDGQIQLQLSPPELGSLRIEITVKQGVVTAHLETETSAARSVLLDNLPALRDRLAEQDIRIEKFDVDVRREGGQQPDNPGTQDRQGNRSAGTSRGVRSSGAEETRDISTTPVSESSQMLDGRLDVRI